MDWKKLYNNSTPLEQSQICPFVKINALQLVNDDLSWKPQKCEYSFQPVSHYTLCILC
jgi:hypothetical protein